MTEERSSGIMILGTATALLSLGFMNILQFKPNRILSGESLSAWTALGGWALVIAAGWILACFMGCVLKDRLSRRLGPWFTLGVLLSVVASAGYGAAEAIPEGNAIARVALGPGFWGQILGGYILLKGWELKASGRFSRIPLLLFPAGVLFLIALGALDQTSVMREFFNRRESFLSELVRHFNLAVGSVILGGSAGVLWGIWIHYHRKAEKLSFIFINLSQTIPTLSLLGLLMVPLGYLGSRYPLLSDLGIRAVGWAPAFIALTLYALLPVTANTVSGLKLVNPETVEAAEGMGMNPIEVFRNVKLPISTPYIASGFRTALTQSMGNTILAGLIGGGGMGAMIFLGLAQSAPDLVLLGALPVVFLALASDVAMELLAHWLLIRESGVNG